MHFTSLQGGGAPVIKRMVNSLILLAEAGWLPKLAFQLPIGRLNSLNKRTLDVITSRLYFYYSLSYEKLGDLAEICGTQSVLGPFCNTALGQIRFEINAGGVSNPDDIQFPHQTFTISRIFDERQRLRVYDFVVDGGNGGLGDDLNGGSCWPKNVSLFHFGALPFIPFCRHC
ncbi:Uncharacterized protein Rs2_15990 [Raphanus sativus]|nr:Uncharacterized protein Rs2_14661 [Raphanus sativus]KAJ4902039.1 Uncharacterized protein Rs2_15990 [Raphanus sativus]